MLATVDPWDRANSQVLDALAASLASLEEGDSGASDQDNRDDSERDVSFHVVQSHQRSQGRDSTEDISRMHSSMINSFDLLA